MHSLERNGILLSMYGYACAQIFRRARLIKDTHMTIVICAAFAIPLSFAKRRLQHSAVVMAMVENAVCKKVHPFHHPSFIYYPLPSCQTKKKKQNLLHNFWMQIFVVPFIHALYYFFFGNLT